MSIKITTTGPFVSADIHGDLALEDLEPLFQALDAARQRGLFVLLTDTTNMKSSPRAVISAFAERLKREMPNLKRIWLGDAVVMTSPTIRFVLSTLVMIAPLPTHVKAF